MRNHKQFLISYQHACHISARNEVGSKRKEISPPSRREEVCICTDSEPGICFWNSSGGELTDVNLLQIPNLLLAPDLFFFTTLVLLWES